MRFTKRKISVKPPRWMRSAVGVGLCGVLSLAACDDAVLSEEPVNLRVAALSGAACGEGGTASGAANPFAEVNSVTLGVRTYDVVTQSWITVNKETASLREGDTLSVDYVPEGRNREVILVAEGASGTWYGRDTGINVRRERAAQASMLLGKMGESSCVPAPQGIGNTLFPSAALLDDGRILVTGGFTKSEGGKLSAPSDQAFLFNSRTGEREVLGSIGPGRAGHASIFLPETNKVILVGGMTEMAIDKEQPFPYVYDRADGLDDVIIFDVATKSFVPAERRLSHPRAFPRLARLTDGTILISGGGEWPFSKEDGRPHIQSDVFDPEANGFQGNLQSMDAPLQSFYGRSGHSLTYIDESADGLSNYLLWGGATLARSQAYPAEVYHQSGRQRDGINGTFMTLNITGDQNDQPGFTYFHETTRLDNRRFLTTGGVHTRGEKFEDKLRSDESWLLTYYPRERFLDVRRVKGFGPGRVFHSAFSPDGEHVNVVGGWNPLEATEGVARYFSLDEKAWFDSKLSTAGRGGQAAVLTPSGAIFMAGGEKSAEDAPADWMATEMYYPETLPVP